MDNQQAKILLQLYRPGIDDADPQFADALALARRDHELGQWLADHAASYLAIRAKLKQIPVPTGLWHNILDQENRRVTGARGLVPLHKIFVPLAAAAAIVLFAAGAWFTYGQLHKNDFANYRNRIVLSAQRGYNMSMTSTNLAAIHQYILDNKYPDYSLPAPLAKLQGEGCATLNWHDQKVSMICLNAKRGRDLFLFVIDTPNVGDAPAAMEYAQIHRLNTASWTEAGKTYILAGPTENLDLKEYVN